MFRRDDFQKLVAQLQGIDGQFLLSLDDVPEARETFAAFHVESVTTDCSVGSKKGDVRKKVGEVIISNSSPADNPWRLIWGGKNYRGRHPLPLAILQWSAGPSGRLFWP